MIAPESWFISQAPLGPERVRWNYRRTPCTMVHRLATKAGRALYGLRKQTVELVFGNIKRLQVLRAA